MVSIKTHQNVLIVDLFVTKRQKKSSKQHIHGIVLQLLHFPSHPLRSTKSFVEVYNMQNISHFWLATLLILTCHSFSAS